MTQLALIFNTSSELPHQVKIAPRLHNDVLALELLFSHLIPPLRLVCPSKFATATICDASGAGFGSSLQLKSDLQYTYGQWNKPSSQKSSNYRELSKLIYAVENVSFSGFLENSELFIFTDNFAVNSTFFKGTSSSKRLFALMLMLHKL
jgi:hypothetical protein